MFNHQSAPSEKFRDSTREKKFDSEGIAVETNEALHNIRDRGDICDQSTVGQLSD